MFMINVQSEGLDGVYRIENNGKKKKRIYREKNEQKIKNREKWGSKV